MTSSWRRSRYRLARESVAEQLTVAQFPADVTPEGAISAVDEKLVGRVVITSISPRDPVTENKLAPIGAAGGLSSVIPEGFRAMTVKVDDIVGVSGFIHARHARGHRGCDPTAKRH